MASSTCHVVGGTKRVRVERTVRRDHATKMSRRASPDAAEAGTTRARPANVQGAQRPKECLGEARCVRKEAPQPKTAMPTGEPGARTRCRPKRSAEMIASGADTCRAPATTCSYAPNA
jgi:hypothetical protein